MLENQPSWQEYEKVTTQILNDERLKQHLNDYYELRDFQVSPKRKFPGEKTGTQWEVDGFGYDLNNKLVLLECKHFSEKNINQNTVAAFAYIIKDIGADRGIIVTTLGLQSGADKVAQAESIGLIKLQYNSTENNYVIHFSNKTPPNLTTVALTDQMGGPSFGGYSSTETIIPFLTRPLWEEATKNLQERTNRKEFSEAEVIEEVKRIQNLI